MNEVECPCCKGAGKITIAAAPKRPPGVHTLKELSKISGRTQSALKDDINRGLLTARIVELRVRTKRGWMLRNAYVVTKDEARSYIEYVTRNRVPSGKVHVRPRTKAIMDMVADDMSYEAIGIQLGIKPASVARRVQAEKARRRANA